MHTHRLLRRTGAGTRPPGRARRLRRLVSLLVAVTALVAGMLTLGVTQAQAKALEEHNPASCNMEGGQGGNVTPKWDNDIPKLTRSHDVLALQEAGPIPPLVRDGVFRFRDEITVNGHVVYHFVRNFGTRSRPMERNVYFMETDPNGHRVNLAMVTEAVPDTLWATVHPNIPGARPSFGVQFGGTVFNNIHALSGSGADVPGMVTRIDAGQRRPGRDWVVMGDFNRDPENYDGARLPANTHIYRPGVATHIGRGEFDYMMSNRSVPLYSAHAMPGISADHLPVEFRVLRPRGGPLFEFGNYHSYNHRYGERVLEIPGGNPANGTHITLFDNHRGSNQAFEFVPLANGNYQLKSPVTKKCLDMYRGLRTGPGDFLNEWPCDNLPTQQWRVEFWQADPGAAAIINGYAGDCLDVSRNENRNGSWAVIQTCNGHDSQKWTLQYFAS
ncbi:RICIN domain-containing protein [Streptomyces sp. NPDC001262]|uniref:RICIN domain-containing protein n=1 Tax=Streptomyces sp. NPDC001262 TaxID=3364552 RepID=UPI00368C8689